MGQGLGKGYDTIVFSYPSATDPALPATGQDPFGIPVRHRVNMESYVQARLAVHIQDPSSSGTSLMQAQYTTDLTGAGGWADLVGVNIPMNVAGTFVSAWGNIPAGAKLPVEVLIRLITQNGAGAGDSVTMLGHRIDLR